MHMPEEQSSYLCLMVRLSYLLLASTDPSVLQIYLHLMS
jgi:hypothetical protein